MDFNKLIKKYNVEGMLGKISLKEINNLISKIDKEYYKTHDKFYGTLKGNEPIVIKTMNSHKFPAESLGLVLKYYHDSRKRGEPFDHYVDRALTGLKYNKLYGFH